MEELVAAAIAAASKAHCPHSDHPVGAALEAADGSIAVGCNVESDSYPLTVCAERNAVANAVVAGLSDFTRIVVVSPSGGAPCGGCRQVLFEHGGSDLQVICATSEGEVNLVTTIGELLPHAFRWSRD